MKIAMRGGHSDHCGGAVGYLNEYNECQKVYKETARLLKEKGHIIVDCNSHESSAQNDLYRGTNIANANEADLFISIHMNAGGGNGVEAWCYDSNSQGAVSYGQIMCKNISANMEIPNRGVKYNPSFHDLRCTKMQAIILECLFVDGKGDYIAYKKYGYERLARCIAHSIDSSIPIMEIVAKPSTPKYNVDYVLVVDDGALPDYNIGDTMRMILTNKGYEAHLLTADDYATNKYGDYVGKNVILIGGALKGRFKYDAIFAGKDRNETAYLMYQYLKDHDI